MKCEYSSVLSCSFVVLQRRPDLFIAAFLEMTFVGETTKPIREKEFVAVNREADTSMFNLPVFMIKKVFFKVPGNRRKAAGEV